jgi:hypothetical protein
MTKKKSRPLNLDDFDAIEWDPEDDPTGNHAHCAEHGVDERIVDEVLSGEWVDVEMQVDTAEFAIVGPNAKGILCGPYCSTPLGNGTIGFVR